MFDLSELNLSKFEFLTKKEIQLIETNEFEKYKNSFKLMSKAGGSIAEYITGKLKPGKKILILVGPGNNGGDGYIATSLLTSNFVVSLLAIEDPKTEDAKHAKSLVKFEEVNCLKVNDLSKLDDFDIIVDSLFGIGLKTEIRSPYNQLLEKLAEVQDKVISIDLPSGLDCDTNQWYGPKFEPKVVLTMEFTKSVMKNWDINSEIVVCPLGFHLDSIYLTSDNMVSKYWRSRNDDSHKGENGRVMVIGGSDEFTGAPVLSGKAILRTGVDTLRIAVPETIRDIVAGYNQDFIVVKVRGEHLNSKSFKKFRNLTKHRHDVVVMGMGLSNHGETQKFVREIVDIIKDDVTLVLDADAIRPFRDKLSDLKGTNAIITPHKAELRFLLKNQLPDEFPDLINFVMETAKLHNLVILLKGKIDIITNGSRIFLNQSGTSSMTVGGTGDVLAGVVAAVNCFVNDKTYATAIAAYIMGLAGELATKKFGLGMLASDLIEEIPNVLNNLSIY